MTKCRQLALIFGSSVALAALASHGIMKGLRVQGMIPAPDFGQAYNNTPIIVAGSSLIYYAFDWEAVARAASRRVRMLTAPAASPCELDALQVRAPVSDLTIIGVGESDMDEDKLSDFLADLVPVTQMWRDLRASRAPEALVQRTIGKYPLYYARMLFPSAGRSMALLVGIREALHKLVHRHQAAASAEPLPTFDTKGLWPTNRVSDWNIGRALRNIEVERQLTTGHHWFHGPKRLALERMLQRSLSHGTVMVIIMPNSPLYGQEVINPGVMRDFEKSLDELIQRFPQAKWFRMDQVARLKSNDYFWDLDHFNADARPIATAELLKQLAPLTGASP